MSSTTIITHTVAKTPTVISAIGRKDSGTEGELRPF
jgi:hypothetical protein